MLGSERSKALRSGWIKQASHGSASYACLKTKTAISGSTAADPRSTSSPQARAAIAR